MKYSLVAVTLAAVVTGQSLSDIPSCAIPCLDKAIASETSCDKTDVTCICKDFESVQGAATSCILKDCGSDTALNEVLPAAQALCEGGGDASSAKPSSAAEQTSAEVTSAAETSAAETSVADDTSALETLPSIIDTVTATEVTATETVSTASFIDTVITEPVVSTPGVTPVPSGGSNSTFTSKPSGASSGTEAPSSSTSAPANGAAALGSMGGFAMLVLGALAL